MPNMYQQRPTTTDLMFKNNLKLCITVSLCMFGLILGILGGVFYGCFGDLLPYAGIIMLVITAAMYAICILMCCNMYTNAKEELAQMPEEDLSARGQPLVSGYAPPGAVSGYHIQATQNLQQQDRQPLRQVPTAPYESPPSYYEVANKV